MRARIGACQKKQKDDESDDDKPLGKLKKEGAGSKRKAAVCKGFRGVLAGCKCGVRVCVCVRVCADEGDLDEDDVAPFFIYIFPEREKELRGRGRQ